MLSVNKSRRGPWKHSSPDRPVTLSDALRHGEAVIAEARSDEPRLEAELLLMHALGSDRARLYQRFNEDMTAEQEVSFRSLLGRRARHEPTAYITGHREFFGLEFEVSPAAIIPRPETEALVESIVKFVLDRHHGEWAPRIADVGCGSGVIAVSLAHVFRSSVRDVRGAQFIAIDSSPQALSLCKTNAMRHRVTGRLSCLLGDLLAPLTQPVDIIAANLPYVRTADWEALPPEIRDHEPRLGLDGGQDGLREIGRLLASAPPYLLPGGALFAEIGDEQGAAVAELARVAFPHARLHIERDLAGRDRVLVVEPAEFG